MKLGLFIKLSTAALILILISNTRAQTPDANSGTQTKYIGLSDDAYPISFWSNGRPAGYCFNFFNALAARSNIKIEFRIVKERFKETSENGQKLDAECGPHTITDDRVGTLDKKKAQFSKPFAWTGAKVLIRSEKVADFDNPLGAPLLRIGASSALNPTTTYNLLSWANKSKIALKEIALDKLDRPDAIEKLKNNQLDAYANDGILLRGILKQQKDLKGFSIIPRYDFLSHEAYGIVVYESKAGTPDNPSKNGELLNNINNFIKNEEFQNFEDVKIFIPNDGKFDIKSDFRTKNFFDNVFYSLIKGENLFLNTVASLIVIGFCSTVISLFLISLQLLKRGKQKKHNSQTTPTPKVTISPQLEKTLVIVQILRIVQDLPEESELQASKSNEIKNLISQLKTIVENEEVLTPEEKNRLVNNVEDLESIVLNPESQKSQQDSGQSAVDILKTIASALPEAAKILESLTGIAKTLGIH